MRDMLDIILASFSITLFNLIKFRITFFQLLSVVLFIVSFESIKLGLALLFTYIAFNNICDLIVYRIKSKKNSNNQEENF